MAVLPVIIIIFVMIFSRMGPLFGDVQKNLGLFNNILQENLEGVRVVNRAIFTEPQLLIFDEATANIDTQTKQLVQAAIDELLRDRTAFVVAHRLSTIRHANKICVLGGGGILEQGSHDELLAQGGAYAGLIRAQEGA